MAVLRWECTGHRVWTACGCRNAEGYYTDVRGGGGLSWNWKVPNPHPRVTLCVWEWGWGACLLDSGPKAKAVCRLGASWSPAVLTVIWGPWSPGVVSFLFLVQFLLAMLLAVAKKTLCRWWIVWGHTFGGHHRFRCKGEKTDVQHFKRLVCYAVSFERLRVGLNFGDLVVGEPAGKNGII